MLPCGCLTPGCSLVQDALDALHLPVRLVEGRIGRLQIRVPWSRLRSEPIEIECDDLLLRVRLRDEPDAAAHNQREQLRKRMQLDAEELLRGLRADAGLAHEQRVVLRPPSENLDHSPDLLVAADNWIHFAVLDLREKGGNRQTDR